MAIKLERIYEIKAQHPDAMVLFRLGDFYEVFGTDAEILAPILGVALTRRRFADRSDAIMCGFPVHAADHWLAKLRAAGLNLHVSELTPC